MNKITAKLKKLAIDSGAVAVGVSSVDRLTEHPSMDAGYLLPGARSIVSIMIAYDNKIVNDFLAKKNGEEYQKHETEVYRALYNIGLKIAEKIEEAGGRAKVAEPNLDYRYKDHPSYKKIPSTVRQRISDFFALDSSAPVKLIKRKALPRIYNTGYKRMPWSLTPSFSHRYGAVAAGIGHIGWSGNVLHPEYGARVLYNTVVTDLDLGSDPMIDESPCDGCRICTRVCQSKFIDAREKVSVTIGGRTFEHNRKAHNLRCIFVCAGFSGQNAYPEWSTWSPGKITLPADDGDLEEFWKRFIFDNLWRGNFFSKALSNLTYHSENGYIRKTEERFKSTCGFCQLVCSKTRAERKENLKTITESPKVKVEAEFG